MSGQIKPEQNPDFQAWELPFVQDDSLQDDGKTNALNKPRGWKYEPPEPVEEILPPTAEEIEAIRQAAKEEGFAEGKEEGLAQGLEEGRAEGLQQGLEQGQQEGREQAYQEAQQEIDEAKTLWQGLCDSLHKPVAQVEQQLEQELVRLAVQLARAVIGVEVKSNQDVIFGALSEGVKVLPIQAQRYQIHMHPDDIALVRSHFSDEEVEKHGWQLIEAPHLSRGGCDISTEQNAVDVTLERRCKEVLDKFLLQQGLAQVQPIEDD